MLYLHPPWNFAGTRCAAMSRSEGWTRHVLARTRKKIAPLMRAHL
jgi:hypothetical protein